MHVVLVPAPHIKGRRTMPYFPLGVLSLHQVLSDAGHDCTIYYPHLHAGDLAETDMAIRQWAAEVVAAEPDWVGFSTVCNSYPLILLLARAVKHLSPQTPVVLGGPQASVVAEESMAAFPWIDYIVRGEAEQAVLGLVQVIEHGSEPQGAGSITYRANGKIVSTPLVPLLTELDSLALPDYQAYPYFREALLDDFIPFEPGRGCPYGCSFCSTSDFWRRRMRQKSPDLLADQLGMIVRRYQVENVLLAQDLLVLDRDWLGAFLGAMETGDRATWTCRLRPDSVGARTLADMYRAGCTHVFFGVESGSQRVQKRLQKNLDLTRTRETIEAAVSYGMGVITSFIVGFPWETRQDLQETLSLHQHFLDIGVAKSQVYVLCPLPKTPLTIQYTSRLSLAPLPSFLSMGLEDFRTAEMQRMIRQYPEIFSSFYHVKSEFVPHEEFAAAAWAGNALYRCSKGEQVAAQTRVQPDEEALGSSSIGGGKSL